MAYAELHCLSNFTFLRGASSARELFQRAKELGYEALAITDECTLAGIVRAHEAAEEAGLKLIIGSEFRLSCGMRFVLLVRNALGYRCLCQLITLARRAARKGEYELTRGNCSDVLASILDSTEARAQALQALYLPGYGPQRDAPHEMQQVQDLQSIFPDLGIALALHRGAWDAHQLKRLQALATQLRLPLVATGQVHMHTRGRRALQDTLSAIRHRCTLSEAGFRLHANGERHLRQISELRQHYPEATLAEAARIAHSCDFNLKQLRYTYPHELVPAGVTAGAWLRTLSEQGMATRWPQGVSSEVRAQVEHELALIAELGYESYFLTVHDIVRHARSQQILCQGRGSAANSAVCYCLGITEVDPSRMNMLFERFISRERNEPPDIDVDFEHDRREEVIQYIYRKYGRERAALAATVICYRPKSALRDVGKALGMSLDQVEQICAALAWWDGMESVAERLQERGFNPETPLIRKLLTLTRELLGFPRHLSQHVGGFVISEQPLSTLVPVENASMPERTIIQWDKDDLDTLGLLKVDCLALGMLSAIRRCLNLMRAHHGLSHSLASIPAEDPDTYAMIQQADTIGVFQIESRAQMSMLPRLKPARFYDLVIEVAIVRPGPIQGKMVHPYLRRRQGKEAVEYPSEDLRRVFERTLGVPIFQEQVMQLAIVAAGFSPGEADQLRRSMAAWKRRGGLDHFQKRILEGMAERGYSAEFALQVFEQIRGFGSYGFPESHAASFALLVYCSAWLKCHYPAAFTCALLNSLPMGFYGPAQLIGDAKRHGVRVLPVDVQHSVWDCTLEPMLTQPPEATQAPVPGATPHALRLGFSRVSGLCSESLERMLDARREGPWRDAEDVVRRGQLDAHTRRRLAEAGAFASLLGDRHQALWAVSVEQAPPEVLTGARIQEPSVLLRQPTLREDLFADYASTGLSLKQHPVSLIRTRLNQAGYRCAEQLKHSQHGARVRVAGLVTLRQRPGTAAGVTFVTLEDESGMCNLIIWKRLAEKQRRVLLESQCLGVSGELQQAEGVTHVLAHRLYPLDDWLQGLDMRSRDFH